MDCAEAVKYLKSQSNVKNVKGMARFGINVKGALGISMPKLRSFAKKLGKNHALAQQLWKTGIHEAKILAGLVDEPKKVNERQMEKWVRGFDSWDVCDQTCLNLFHETEYAYKKCHDWSKRREEYVKRAGFALMAVMAVHGKEFNDRDFIDFFPSIKRGTIDDRNFVKKAVNWALRQIGKRNEKLRKEAVKLAESIAKMDFPSSKWIARDALRELKKK
ncbi:MAG: DNA alkylation repair protein [Elusimicrobiota bacterium]